MDIDAKTFAIITIVLSIVIGLCLDFYADWRNEWDKYWEDIDWKDEEDDTKRTKSGKK